MFEQTTVTRPTPTSVREVGYYWLGAGIVAGVLVALFVGSRIGATTATFVTAASAFLEFAVFGGAILAKEREA